MNAPVVGFTNYEKAKPPTKKELEDADMNKAIEASLSTLKEDAVATEQQQAITEGTKAGGDATKKKQSAPEQPKLSKK